jgi:hypothetical protein
MLLALSCVGQRWIELGPLYHEFGMTLEPGVRVEALGPLFSYQELDDERQTTWPPFMAYRLDEIADLEEFDFAYPIFTYDRFGKQYRYQLMQLLSLIGGELQDGEHSARWTVFPFYFRQASTKPGESYGAALPFYGRISHRLFRDQVRFILPPLYVETRKRDMVTENYVYPFFHLRRGNGLKGWQLWPLYGEEHKALTTRTNLADELVTIGAHEKRFVLWPLYLREHVHQGTPEELTAFLSFPFYKSERSAGRDSTTVLWPLWTYTEDREKQFEETSVIWPFFGWARGPGKTMDRIWPWYSHSGARGFTNVSYLWPVYRVNTVSAPPLQRERRRVLFFLYSDLREAHTETGVGARRVDLWPLYMARTDTQGRRRQQALALLETFLPYHKGIDRGYAPYWTLWRREEDPVSGRRSHALLWNLARWETRPESRKGSLLFGLIQYHSGPESRRLRLFFVPMGGRCSRAGEG